MNQDKEKAMSVVYESQCHVTYDNCAVDGLDIISE